MLIIRLQKNEESGQGNTGKVTARGAAGSGPMRFRLPLMNSHGREFVWGLISRSHLS